MKYQIEATAEGYRLTTVFDSGDRDSGGIRGISLEATGGHDELEKLYAQAEQAWEHLRREYRSQVFGDVTKAD